jgi:excisionase family DNA binding protein
MPRGTTSPFLTTKEAAAYLRIKRRTLANMRHRRTGPEFRKHGGRIVYRIEDLDVWSTGTQRRAKNGSDENDKNP